MENLSNIVVTENGWLKEDFATDCQWAGIVGIHFWADIDKHKTTWRKLEAMTWVFLKEEFKATN